MNNQTLKNIAFWIMILMVITLSIYVLYWIKSESFQCLNNPYSYSVKLLEEANNAEVSCICTPQKPNAVSVLLTKDGFKQIELYEKKNPYEKKNLFNFSNN